MKSSIRLIFKKTTKICNFAPILCKNHHFLMIFSHFSQKTLLKNSHKKIPSPYGQREEKKFFLLMVVNPLLDSA